MRFTHGQGLRMPPQYTNALALVANTHERQAIPTGYQYVVINSTANIYCRLGDETVVASAPGDVVDGTANTGQFINPGIKLHTGSCILPFQLATATTATTVHGFTTIVER